MAATRLDLVIEKGSTWISTLRLTDSSGNYRLLTGGAYTAKLMMRPAQYSDTILSELTTENGGIVFNDSLAGGVYLVMSAEDTSVLGDQYTSVLWYDFMLVGPIASEGSGLPTLGTEKVIKGLVLLDQNITE